MLVYLPLQFGLLCHDRTQSPEKTFSDGETKHVQAAMVGLAEKE